MCAEVAIASCWQAVVFVDGRYPSLERVLDWPVVGSDSDALRFISEHPAIFVAVGDNRRRVQLISSLERAGFSLPVLVHPAAWVSPSATLSTGTVVVGGVIINSDLPRHN